MCRGMTLMEDLLKNYKVGDLYGYKESMHTSSTE